MGQFISTFLIIFFWIISFVDPSGWSMALHLPDKINYFILLLGVVTYLTRRGYNFKYSSGLYFSIAIFFIVIPYIFANSFQGLSYLTSFLVVYIMSHAKITQRVIGITAFIIAGLGIAVLLIYLYGDVLSGWNDNAISMVGLFSFIYFSIYLHVLREKPRFLLWLFVPLIYFELMFTTDCRSGMLFTVFTIIPIFYRTYFKKLLKRQNVTVLVLNIPLLVAFLVLAISKTSYFQELNTWSLANTHKGIFNLREVLWDKSLELLVQSEFIGTGVFKLNYHNSCLAALSVFGVLGYYVWIKYFNSQIKRIRPYLYDKLIFGSLIAFLLIYLQQSVDLGFISQYPNYLPYVILGLCLARVRMYRNIENESKYYNTHI